MWRSRTIRPVAFSPPVAPGQVARRAAGEAVAGVTAHPPRYERLGSLHRPNGSDPWRPTGYSDQRIGPGCPGGPAPRCRAGPDRGATGPSCWRGSGWPVAVAPVAGRRRCSDFAGATGGLRLGADAAVGFSVIMFAGAPQPAPIAGPGRGLRSGPPVLTACTINLRLILYPPRTPPLLPRRLAGTMDGHAAYLLTGEAYALSDRPLVRSGAPGPDPPTLRGRWTFYMGPPRRCGRPGRSAP